MRARQFHIRSPFRPPMRPPIQSPTGAQPGGGGGASLSFAWKATGGEDAAILDAGTATPANLAGKQLILVVTSGASVELETVATNDAGTLVEDGDNTGTIEADTPLEIPFDMPTGALSGIVTVTLTIGGTPYTFTFHCFQWSGTLRAVNSTGASTTGIVVNGVTIGDAGAGYTTLSAAHTAASAGDTVVATESFADTTSISFTKNLIVDVADSARHDGTASANGYRLAVAANNLATSTALIISNVRFVNATSSTSCVVVQAGTTTLRRCVALKTNSFQAFASDLNGNLVVENTIIYLSTSADAVVNAATGGTCVCRNVTVHSIAGGRGFWMYQGTGQRFQVINCIALGSFSVAGYVLTSGSWTDGSANNVGNTSTTPPGADPLTTTAAGYFANVTGGSEDAHCVSRAVLDNFPGTNLSASFAKDIDGTIRTDWYAGADWIAP